MPYPIQAFTSGMILATPEAIASRAIHAGCVAVRNAAWQAARDAGFDVLNADRIGQAAYHAASAEAERMAREGGA